MYPICPIVGHFTSLLYPALKRSAPPKRQGLCIPPDYMQQMGNELAIVTFGLPGHSVIYMRASTWIAAQLRSVARYWMPPPRQLQPMFL